MTNADYRSRRMERLGVVLRRVAARLATQRNSALGSDGSVMGPGTGHDMRPNSGADERPGDVGEGRRTLSLNKGRTYSRQGGRIAAPGEINIWARTPRPRSAGLVLVWDAH